MKPLALVGVLAALSGCAAHHVPVAQVPGQSASTDWAQVCAIPTGTEILVSLDDEGVRRGVLWAVTDTTLTIRDLYSLNAMPRGSVVRVTTRKQNGYVRDPWYLYVPASAVLGGLAGLVVAAVERDKTIARGSALVFMAGMYTGTLAGLVYSPKAKYEERLVYVRP
jgi:hypothetical protein